MDALQKVKVVKIATSYYQVFELQEPQTRLTNRRMLGDTRSK